MAAASHDEFVSLDIPLPPKVQQECSRFIAQLRRRQVPRSLDVARKTEGFSGRAMAKMLLNLQGAVYAEEDCRLTPAVMQQVVKQELIKHRARTGEDGLPARDLMRSPVRRGRNGVAGGAKHASAAAATAAGPPGGR